MGSPELNLFHQKFKCVYSNVPAEKVLECKSEFDQYYMKLYFLEVFENIGKIL